MSSEIQNPRSRYWGVVPAAGVGRRMGLDIPKQYLLLNGKTVIEHTLQRLIAHPLIEQVVVAISDSDQYWTQLHLELDKPIIPAKGGEERCHSVLNALQVLSKVANDKDWVLVHDAVRPCIRVSDIDALIKSVNEYDGGGLLALPVLDTMKRADEHNRIKATIDRKHLWQAQTPQMFRLGALRQALQQSLTHGTLVTDESEAMERMGHHAMLVEGRRDNIKITGPEDLAMAEFFIKATIRI